MGKDAAAEMAVKTKIGKVKNEMRKLESRAESLGLDVVYMEQRVKEKKEQCERYDQSLSAITEEVASRDELAGQIMTKHRQKEEEYNQVHFELTKTRKSEPIKVRQDIVETTEMNMNEDLTELVEKKTKMWKQVMDEKQKEWDDPFNQMMSAQTNPTAESLQPKGGEDDSEEEEDIEQMPVIVSMASELGDDDAVTFLVTARTTFGDLANDACKLWDRNVLNYSLWDDELNVWPISMKVMATLKEVRLVHANQAMRLAIKFEALEAREEGKAGVSSFRNKTSTSDAMATAMEESVLDKAEWNVTGMEPGTDMTFSEAKDLRWELLAFVLFGLLCVTQTYARRDTNQVCGVSIALRTAITGRRFGDSNILKFGDIATREEMWDFLEGPFRKNIFGSDDIMIANKMVGAMRIRQVRTKPNSCNISQEIKFASPPTCYAIYSDETADTSTFGPGCPANVDCGFTYAKDVDQRFYQTLGSNNYRYSGNGYLHDMKTAEEFDTGMDFLKSNRWVDDQTAAVFVNLNVYNPSTNFASAVELFVEFLPNGQAYPDSKFFQFQVDMYTGSTDTSSFVIEMVLLFAILFFLKVELNKYKNFVAAGESMAYIGAFFTWVEWSVITCYLFALAMRSMFYLSPTRLNIDVTTSKYLNMIDLGTLYFNAMAYEGFNYLLMIAKLFKFFKLNRRMFALMDNLSLAGGNVINFFVFFTICILMFAMSGMELFGTQLYLYSRMDLLCSNLLMTVLGEFDYEDMVNATGGSSYAFFYFMGFLISQIFVVINLLLGILGDAYNESKDNMIDGLTKDSDERGRKSYKVLDAVPVYETVLEDIKELLQCDRAAFFVYHRAEHELWTLVGKGNLLRSPAQYGVAGYCVTKQEPAIVVDAYNDYRFHPELDQVTKYTTRHIVACPVYDDNREIVGVIQGMNKLAYNAQTHKWVLAAESFTAVELELLQGYTKKLSNMADEKGSFKDYKRQFRRHKHKFNVLWNEAFNDYVPGTPLVPHPNELAFVDDPRAEAPQKIERLELNVDQSSFEKSMRATKRDI